MATRYLLVHGSWHGAWCWEPLSAILREKGDRVHSIDLPGHGANQKPYHLVTYADYYHCLEKAVCGFREPVILVAHSMSGILAAPLQDRLPDYVKHLFLISAWIPEQGKSLINLATSYNNSEIPSMIEEDVEGARKLNLARAKNVFYHDCSLEIADWAIAHVQPQPTLPLVTPIEWVDTGKMADKRTYVICELDKAVHPNSQRDMVEKHPSNIMTIKSGHFPMLSQPKKLAKILHSMSS